MGTLLIGQVNLKELELQRQKMNSVEWYLLYTDGHITKDQYDAILSIEGMLDSWSDQIWEEANVNS